MLAARLMELLAIGMIGEGIAGFFAPRRYMLLWKFGPKPYQEFIDWFVERTTLTRGICLVEVGLGMWLSRRELRR